jgi:Flp pilus assembly protein TadG
MKMERKFENNRGTTAVEFALILPLFFMLILGIIDFGRFFFVQHTLQFATREGTRLALVGKTLTDQAGNPLSREASIVQAIQQNVSPAVDPLQVSINIFPVQSDYSNPQGWKQQLNAGAPGQFMRVSTQYTFAFVTPMIGAFFPGGNFVVQAQATYRNELFN